MISENILGEKRKWRTGAVEWSAKVVEVNDYSANVQIVTKDGTSGNQSMTIVTWSAGELKDHGFDI